MRLGYLRHVLASCPAMPTAVLTALLAAAPQHIIADSASGGPDPLARGSHRRPLRWQRDAR
jgi:hypothetical protein